MLTVILGTVVKFWIEITETSRWVLYYNIYYYGWFSVSNFKLVKGFLKGDIIKLHAAYGLLLS